MRKMRIGVLDSYIDLTHKAFQDKRIVIRSERNEKDYADSGHGTAVCGAILNECSDAEIFVYPIFNREEVSYSLFIRALYTAAFVDKVDIINLSCGFTDIGHAQISELEELCQRIVDNKTIIIAAYDNEGLMSYPAAFTSVIGVDVCEDLINPKEFRFIQNSYINIQGSDCIRRVHWKKGGYMVARGSSFFAPYISGIVARLIEQGYNTDNVLHALQEMAKENIVLPCKKNPLQYSYNNTKKVLLFPFNKEIRPFAMFSNKLAFEIYCFADIKQSMNVGRMTSEIMSVSMKPDYEIQDIEAIAWNDDFDTVLIGHVGKLKRIVNDSIIEKIIQNAVNAGKQIIVLDKELANQNSKFQVYCPKYSNLLPQTYQFKKMWRIITPIVYVVGTASQNGKFTAQQFLRNSLERKGYRVGYLSTEPTGEAFFADAIFPCGYNSNIDVSIEEIPHAINSILHDIEMKDKDIIVSGGQSGILPYDLNKYNNILLSQIAMMYSINPDVVILCISKNDTIEYIKKTIEYIELAGNTDVLAVILSQFYINNYGIGINRRLKLTDSEYIRETKNMSEKLGRKVYMLTQDDSDAYTSKIIEFLSDE